MVPEELAMCKCATQQNTINTTIGVTAAELLPPNPRRKAIIFTPQPVAPLLAHAISLSFRPDVTVGQGMLNYLQGQFNGILLSDEEIGNAITLPIYAVCGDANTPVQITEILYDHDPNDVAG